MPKRAEKPTTFTRFLQKNPALAERFRLVIARQRTDEVQIGTGRVPDGPDDALTFADVKAAVGSIKWLVRDWVPQGMLTGLIAEPKKGKSAFALLALAAPVLTGTPWFTGCHGPRAGKVLWIDTERSAAVNLDRALKARLPLDRLLIPFADDPLTPLSLENGEHLARAEALIDRHQIRLVVIDSFRGGHDGDENNSRITKVLRDLGGLAERTNTAVVLIHHTRKLNAEESVGANDARGSNAFLASVRCQIAVDQPDPKSDWRRVRVLGENLGISPEPVGFRFAGAGLEFGPAPTRPTKRTQKDDAAEWLRARMTPGEEYPAADLSAEAEQHGIPPRTLRRVATEQLGIKPEPVREGGHIKGWRWRIRKGDNC